MSTCRPFVLAACRRLRRVCAALLLAALVGGEAVRAQSSDGLSAALALEQALTQVVEQSEASVVSIARLRWPPSDLSGAANDNIIRLEGGANPRDSQGPRETLPNQFAAGVVIAPPNSEERFVLTVYHAVRGGPVYGRKSPGDAARLEVRFSSRAVCSARILAADPRCDLAVLKLDERELGAFAAGLRPISWLNSAPARKGQLTVTLGNPYWLARDGSASASWGMVANIARRPAALTFESTGPSTLAGLGGFLHLDQRLPVGYSGAPVLNLRGELIGVSSATAAIEGYERSGGFAIPIDSSTRWIVQALLAGQEVEYGFLGLLPATSVIPPNDPAADLIRQPTAARVRSVVGNSPANLAGVEAGDLILAVDGQPTLTDLDLMHLVTLHPPETTVRLRVYRPLRQTELTLSAKLGKWPVLDHENVIATERRFPPWRGLAVDYPTARPTMELRERQAVPPGVLVTEVAPDSAAHVARLQPGVFVTHVNNKAVRTPAEFAEAVKPTKGEVTLKLFATDGPPRVVVVRE